MSAMQMPLEIVQEIAHHAGIHTLPNLMLTCRRFYRCLITDYEAKKHRFTDLAIMARTEPYLIPDLADYFIGIATYPEVAYFARSLTIEWVKPTLVAADEEPRLHEPGLVWLRKHGGINNISDAEIEHLATAMAERCCSLVAADQVYDTSDLKHLLPLIRDGVRLVRGNSDRDIRDSGALDAIYDLGCTYMLNNLIGLLLVNLPYLTEFSCSWDVGNRYGPRGKPLVYIISRAIDSYYDKINNNNNDDEDENDDGSNGDAPTSSAPPGLYLQEFHYCPEVSDGRDEETSEFGEFARFLRLPNIRRFFGTNLRVDSIPLKPEYSRVEHMELASCSLSAAQVSLIFSQMPDLTIFRYSQQSASYTWDNDGWDVGAFVKAISEVKFTLPSNEQSTLAEQLTDLAISTEDENPCITRGIDPASLRQFTALKKLAVNFCVFLGDHTELRDYTDESIPDEDSTEPNLPCLVDMLPDSLEELEIAYDFSGALACAEIERSRHVGRGFKEQRARRLPQLEKVRVRQRLSYDGTMSAEVVAFGDMLGADEVVSEAYTTLSWRETFDKLHGFYDYP